MPQTGMDDKLTVPFGGIAIASEKRVSVRRHPGQISDRPGLAEPVALNLTVPSRPLSEMLILLDRLAVGGKYEPKLISTAIAWWKFRALLAYHLMFKDVRTARKPVLAAVTDPIHPRVLYRVARVPFHLNWPGHQVIFGKRSVHGMHSKH
jgi:hypothetical protein